MIFMVLLTSLDEVKRGIAAMEHGLPATISLPIPLQVLSRTPERIRVRLAAEYREPEVMEQIAQAMKQLVASLRQVKTTPQTGSLTLYLDPEAGSGDELFGRLEQMGLIEIAPDSSDLPSATRQLTGLMSTWNQRVNQWTEGTADLRFLVPMAFAMLAFRRFLVNGGGLKSAPWYLLAWYAFDSFMKLNPPQAIQPETKSEPTPESLVEASKRPTLPGEPSSEAVSSNNHGRSAKVRAEKSGRS